MISVKHSFFFSFAEMCWRVPSNTPLDIRWSFSIKTTGRCFGRFRDNNFHMKIKIHGRLSNMFDDPKLHIMLTEYEKQMPVK